MKTSYLIICLLALISKDLRSQKIEKEFNSPESIFLSPPVSVRPYVWWHWMGSNFSKEGITKDLEAMKAAGIGGATIFNLSSAVQESHAPTLNNPWPHQTYRSPAYWEAMLHAAKEAERLGLEIGLHNTVGYSTTGGPWIDEERSMQRLVWSDTTIDGSTGRNIVLRAPQLIADEGWGKTGRKISFYKDLYVLAVPSEKKSIEISEVRNLSGLYKPESGLNWKAAEGRWIIYRIGHASTGRPPHPVPDDLLGKVLEADKMSLDQTTFHWQNVLDPVKQHLGPYLGKSFRHILIDSYEAGNQNWTTNFREEFMKRKGYDPVPWLVSFSTTVGTGKDDKNRRIVADEEQTARFDWDYRDVISQLFFEKGWQPGKQMLQGAKLDLQFEPYGGPFNTPQGVALADLPMAEFWTAGVGGINSAVPAAARAAGKKVVGAEAFTGRPEKSQYTEDPAFLKQSADKSFAAGINRLILHHWVHQPFDDKYQPGMGMGWWGTHFGRYQTWFEPGKAFFQYLARCQAMLQFGEQPADYLSLDKSDEFCDIISTPDFLLSNINVTNGKIILPSGRSYPFMVFPGEGIMLPEVAYKIRKLVSEGATIVSAKPFKSPSLKNYPACDQELKKLGDEIWGSGSQNQFKKGCVFTNLNDAKLKSGIVPDFSIRNANPELIRIAHRKSSGTDIYFVSNQSDKPQVFNVSFRISGKQPELWQAEDGSMMNAPIWQEKDGRTSVNLRLKGLQSVFVVFRKTPAKADYLVSVTEKNSNPKWSVETSKNGMPVIFASDLVILNLVYASGKRNTLVVRQPDSLLIKGAWEVAFSPKLEQAFRMTFPELTDISLYKDNRVRYFSGTATYSKTVTLPKSFFENSSRCMLDLGEMNDIAEVRVNGKSAGVVWYPPFKADISHLIRPGENLIEIAVTNNWANRLIGDEQEPADFEWGKDRGESMGRAMLAYPEWFFKNEPRPSQGRKTFNIWYYYRNNSPLKPAGLVGPVMLLFESAVQP